jgi:hypothetical protein
MYKRTLLAGVCLVFINLVLQAQVTFPLKLSSNKRYLVDQHNKPFPILGRTAWFIISLSDTGFKYFIDNTLQHGYNAIEMSVITHWQMGNHAPFDAHHNAPFLKTLGGKDWDGNLKFNNPASELPDFLTPNEGYWKHVDELLAYCEAKGILVLMFPGYVGYSNEKEDQGWMKELVANTPPNVEKYGAWIAKRYKNRKNIVWMLLGDKGKYTSEQQLAEEALIKGLKSVTGQQSVHYTAESSSGENAADNIFFGKEMTLNASYTWELRVPVPYIARKAYAHEPVMPSFLLEEPYDEEGPDGNNYNPNATQPVRRFQWWGWLSTTGGYMAGNGYVWQFVDPIWQQHLNTQAAYDMERLNAFIRSINWWQLVPSGLNGMQVLITDSNNVDSSAAYVLAAAAKDGSLLVAYIPPAHIGNITVNMQPLNKNMYGYWFDPTNGRYTLVNDSPFSNAGNHVFTPPGVNSKGDNDWVLLLTEQKR